MKYFTKEVKIALMAIVAIVLLFVGINFLKGVNIFKSSNSYYVRFNNIQGLAVSSPVYANGYSVGTVRSINYDYGSTSNVVVCIELDKAMNVPQGTRAELETELMGGVKMSLVLGPNPTQNLAPGDTITGGMHEGALSKLEAMIPAIETMLPKIDSILTNLNRISADPALQQMLQNTAALTANLKETSASLNTMMQNDIQPTMASLHRSGDNLEKVSGDLAKSDIAGTMTNVNNTLTGVQNVTTNLTQTTDLLNNRLTSTDNSLGLFLNDRSLYDNLNSTMSNADSLMYDLRAHPKRYVHFSVFGGKGK